MASSVSTPKLPTSLVGVLNRPDDLRDSAYFSNKDPASKHNSIQSNGVHSIDQIARTELASIVDITTSPRLSGSRLPLKTSTSGTMSVASMVSPVHQGLSQSFHQAGSHYSGISINSNISAPSTNDDPRRESVDSRLGANFGDMRLANSPYVSANPSTTSLQSNLAQQRNPSSALQDRNSVPYLISQARRPRHLPLHETEIMSGSRTAPLITGPTKGAIARAFEPTKGQAWAFPEEPINRKSTPIRQSTESLAPSIDKLYGEFHNGSYTESITSSHYTSEPRLPPGQRRFEDGIPPDRNQRGSSELDFSTHHHSLQHKQLTDLQTDGDSPNNSQPYSRTPELRVSHKLAERKRRLEMKDLFNNLRSLQNGERTAKLSKFEILSKAISEHERQTKFIDEQKKVMNRLESQLQRLELELENSRRDSNTALVENARLRSELTSLQNSCGGMLNHGAVSHLQHSYSGPRTGSMAEPLSQLPPIRNIHMPEVMNGLQYHHESRPDGYRTNLGRF